MDSTGTHTRACACTGGEDLLGKALVRTIKTRRDERRNRRSEKRDAMLEEGVFFCITVGWRMGVLIIIFLLLLWLKKVALYMAQKQ